MTDEPNDHTLVLPRRLEQRLSRTEHRLNEAVDDANAGQDPFLVRFDEIERRLRKLEDRGL